MPASIEYLTTDEVRGLGAKGKGEGRRRKDRLAVACSELQVTGRHENMEQSAEGEGMAKCWLPSAHNALLRKPAPELGGAVGPHLLWVRHDLMVARIHGLLLQETGG